MQSKGNQPNAAQVRWREAVRDQGCIMGMGGPVEVHHVVGCTGKHLRQPIGHWWILPVSNDAHRIVERMPKCEQKELFRTVCRSHIEMFGELPFSADVLLAIWDWHR